MLDDVLHKRADDGGARASAALDDAEARLYGVILPAFEAARERVTNDNLSALIAGDPTWFLSPAAAEAEFLDLGAAITAAIDAAAVPIEAALIAEGVAAARRERRRIASMVAARARAAAQKGDVLLDLDAVNSRALAALSAEQMKLIREFRASQRRNVLDILRRGITQGINPNEMAREIRSGIGLTSRQSAAVGNYRRALENAHKEAGAVANAIGRELHDGRFTSAVMRAGRTGKALTQAQVDKMVARYRSRYIDYRARTIARTEALTAVHAGEAAAWEQAIEQGAIKAPEVTQKWVATRDARTRDSHMRMNGQVRKWGEAFLSGHYARLRFPGDPMAPARERCNCRCVVVRTLTDAAGVVVATESVSRTWQQGGAVSQAVASGALVPPVAPAAGPGQAAASDAFAYRNASKNYKSIAAEHGGVTEIPKGVYERYGGRAVSDALGGWAPVEETMSMAEVEQTVTALKKMADTRLAKELVVWTERAEIETASGWATFETGKTVEVGTAVDATVSVQRAARMSTSLIRLRMPSGANALFSGGGRQGVIIPPGSRLVIRGTRRVMTRAELLAEGEMAGVAETGMLNPGTKGFTIIDAELVAGQTAIGENIAILQANVSARMLSVQEIEREIAALRTAKPPLPEPKPRVRMKTPKGDAYKPLASYLENSFEGANDIGRRAANLMEKYPFTIEEDGGKAVYYPGLFGGRPRMFLRSLTAETDDLMATFRHESGHWLDDMGKEDALDIFGVRVRFGLAEMTAVLMRTDEAWRVAVGAAEKISFNSVADIAKYMRKKYRAAVGDLTGGRYGLRDDPGYFSLTKRYAEAVVYKFETETGLDLTILIGKDAEIETKLKFVLALESGNVEALSQAVSLGTSKTGGHLQDMMGSVSRLRFGYGHSREYYMRDDALRRGLRVDGVMSGEHSILTQNHTTEAFADWYSLYCQGPGMRQFLRKFVPELNAAFEDYLIRIAKRGKPG